MAVYGTSDSADPKKKLPKLVVGRASMMYGGTVKVPAPAGAVHCAVAPLVFVLSVAAVIRRRTFPPPPVQVTVIPLDRVTVGEFSGLTRDVGNTGIGLSALKGPTFAPPVPVIAPASGIKKRSSRA